MSGKWTGGAASVTRLPLADRTMRARKEGTCPLCGGLICIGQYIARTGTTWQHASCLVRAVTAARSA